MNRLFLAVVFLASMCACVSDQKAVRNAVAAREYAQARFTRYCVQQGGPSTCSECQVAGNDLRREIEAANEAQKDGKLPKKARKNLAAAVAKLEQVCP